MKIPDAILQGKDIIVLDLEILRPIEKQSDWDNTHLIDISCCVLYSYLENRYHVYGINDLEYLRMRILSADLVVSYNGNKFDLPVIYKLPNRRSPEGIKSYDILAEIWKSRGLDPTIFTPSHAGYSLDNVSRGTLNRSKSGTGTKAPLLWQEGEYCRVIDYCINDVALTKEVFDYIIQFGCVHTTSKYNKTSRPTDTIILEKEIYDRNQNQNQNSKGNYIPVS
jgi:hypothetical protein